MPHERKGGEHRPEQEPTPYYKAARFSGEQPAGKAYFQAQQAIFENEDNALSVYRVQLNKIWHVVTLGEPPPQDLEQKLETILSTGESTSIPSDILKLLQDRRAKATKLGPWVEKHFRPGNKP